MKDWNLLVLLSYATIYIVWGSTYFFIKMAVATIQPLFVVGVRFFVGGFFFLLFAVLTGKIKERPTLSQIGASILLGSFLLLGGNGLISYAERKVDSYLVALIIASTPLLVALFDSIILGKKITVFRLIGIIVGEIGVVLLIYDGKSFSTSINSYLLMVILAMLLWSFATSLGHRFKVYPDNTVNAGIQMLFAGTVSIIITLSTKELSLAMFRGISFASLIGLAYLTVIGSLAFSAYTYLLTHEPAYRVVSYAFVNPVIAVLLGFLFGNEKAVPYLAVGFPLILLGLAFMLYGKRLFGLFKQS